MTFAVAAHVRILAEAGHSISIIGSHPAVLNERLPVDQIVYISASGSGSLYSPARVDRFRLAQALREYSPNIVVVEGWQTALTTAAVEVASSLGMPILMISHGSSLHPFTEHFIDVLRAWAWLPYKRLVLPKLIAKIDVLTTLDDSSSSARFYDRELAIQFGKTVLTLVNAPANWSSYFLSRAQRHPQVLVLGYFSSVKNQLAALEVAARLHCNLKFKFIGDKRGRYYEQCTRRAADLGITDRVIFSDDVECDIATEISRSLVVLSSSVTEVLPLTLIEAMASGTPFVATPVGAVPSFRGGLHAQDVDGLSKAIQLLIDDQALWDKCSESGRLQHFERYRLEQVEAQLHAAIAAALPSGRCNSEDSIALPPTETNCSINLGGISQ